MTMVSKFTLAAALALGATTVMQTPATAQAGYGGQSAQPTPPPADSGNERRSRRDREAPAAAPSAAQGEVVEFNSSNISDGARGPVAAAQAALQGEATDLAATRAQLEAAAAAIQNDDDKFIVGQLMLQLGVKMQQAGQPADQVQALQGRGLRLAVESNRLTLAQRSTYFGFLGNMASGAEDWTQALSDYENALRYNPNNVEAAIQLARAQFRGGNAEAGYTAADRAFAAAREQGMDIPGSWVTLPLNAALAARDVNRIGTYGAMLVSVEPTPSVWSQTLLGYAAAAQFDDQSTLDMMRLLRATGSLESATYNEYANLAMRRGFPGEAQSVIDQARAAGITINSDVSTEVQARLSGDRAGLADGRRSAQAASNGLEALNTADAYASYGEYDTALELYRLASEKGGVDAGLINLRMAATLVAANQAGQARQAFEAITGARQPMAKFWLAYLAQQPDGAATPSPAPATAPDDAPAE